MKRRDLLLGALATGATLPLLPRASAQIPAQLPAQVPAASAPPQPPPTALAATRRSIEVNGKAADVFGLQRPDGAQGLILDAEADFDVALANTTGEATLIHWHGLTPPWPQDGVPDTPAPLMAPGERRLYRFPVGPGGTHWMHAHTLQEQALLAAPLIVRTAEDRAADMQEVVVLLHDFSFTPAEELLARLRSDASGHGGTDHAGTPSAAPAPAMGGHARMNHGGMNHGGMDSMGMSGMAMGSMPMNHGTAAGGMNAGVMAAGTMDLNDIDFDAYLANDRTLADPQVVAVEPGGRVRLRLINAAAATAFTLDTGALEGELIAVDGRPVAPMKGHRFPVVMGQRLDVRLAIPAGGGAFPLLAFREGARERTGLILATRGAAISRVAAMGEEAGPVIDLAMEQRLRPIAALPARTVDQRFAVSLSGTMAGYDWSIGDGAPLAVRRGQRVEIAMRNASMMMHPMHLHGHHFQVVEINGTRLSGAVRDTVAVPPMTSVTVAFDADNPGRWAFHCHHLYHMVAGMMSFVAYEGVG